ncbi:MAG: carbonic anhydrase [bacterium]
MNSLFLLRPVFLATAVLVTLMTSACVHHSWSPSGAVKSTAVEGENDPRRATPDAALAAMKAGNARFLDGDAKHHSDALQRVEATAKSQYPFATVIGCADSRTPPEVIFDAGIGDLFVCRVAGVASSVNDEASLEYGSAVLGVPVIVVLGHTGCGAIKAAIANKPLPGSLPHLVAQIRPAVKRAERTQPHADGSALLDAATREQVNGEIRRLESSPVLGKLLHEGKLKIVGAIYHVGTGRVTWL